AAACGAAGGRFDSPRQCPAQVRAGDGGPHAGPLRSAPCPCWLALEGGPMPEYLAPGVYVEEVSFRSKSIEGVSTTTTGFVGPTRYGPVAQESDVLTSLLDFERVFGDGQQLTFEGAAGPTHNYVWQGARAFF